MKQKASNLLAFAKGQQPKPPIITVHFVRIKEKVYVSSADFIENGSKDYIIKQCSTREDAEFFDKEFNEKLVVDQVRQVLISDQKTGKQTYKKPFER